MDFQALGEEDPSQVVVTYRVVNFKTNEKMSLKVKICYKISLGVTEICSGIIPITAGHASARIICCNRFHFPPFFFFFLMFLM